MFIVKDFGKALLKTNPPRFSFHTNYPNGNRYLKLPSVPKIKRPNAHRTMSMEENFCYGGYQCFYKEYFRVLVFGVLYICRVKPVGKRENAVLLVISSYEIHLSDLKECYCKKIPTNHDLCFRV